MVIQHQISNGREFPMTVLSRFLLTSVENRMKESTNVLLIMVLEMLLIEASTFTYKVSSNNLKMTKMGLLRK